MDHSDPDLAPYRTGGAAVGTGVGSDVFGGGGGP
ncbi:MAG: hypothetical protein JWQ45_1275 [Blastococcus sp.]|nr:hypothetical protein [Blastococcus sp.]